LFILGDFLEAWIGDDERTPLQEQIASALKDVSESGTDVFLMHGNRDFLIGEDFCNRAGAALLDDPTVIDLYGTPALLMHGDSLCTARSEEHTSDSSHVKISYAVFCLKKKNRRR